jgi:branched-chain amino acid transport system substrate-binding protein
VLFWLAGLSVALAQESPIVVGVAVSRSGAQADLGAAYTQGLERWRDELNAGGGLLGRPVELRFVDDASRAARAGEVYAQLIREGKADLLIGPYGSAATIVAAAEAERAQRVMLNAAGPAAAVHARAPKYVFQSAIPYRVYGAGVLEAAAEAGYRRLFIVARDDPASREMAEGALKAAGKDFSNAEVAFYRAGAEDFAAQVEKARATEAQAWIAFGGAPDAAEMVKTFKRLRYAPKLFFASSASDPRFIERLGQDAEWTLGALDFPPGYPGGRPAAQGYVAGTVLAAAVRNAGTLHQEKLRAALAGLEIATLLGIYRVDPKSGAQTGARPQLMQVRKGRLQPGRPVLPYPQWDERVLME